MKPGDIIFTRPKSKIFNIIRWWTKGEYGHVCLAIAKISNHIFITEALQDGVDVNDFIWKKKKNESYIVYRNTRTVPYKIENLINRVVSYHGSPYDTKALLNFIIGRTCFGTDKAVYCSELIYRALCSCNMIKKEFDAERISPKMLRDVLDKTDQFEIVEKHA